MYITKDNLIETAKSVHSANREKGFWDEPKTIETIHLLIVSELVEAVEAERKGTNEPTKAQYTELLKDFDPAKFKAGYKDTIIDELADTVIRCLDYIGCELHRHKYPGRIGWSYVDIMQHETKQLTPEMYKRISLTSFAWGCISDFSRSLTAGSPTYLIAKLQTYAKSHNLPLSEAIDAKLLYNQSRPYRHGKKY